MSLYAGCQLRRTDIFSLVDVKTLSVGAEENLRPRKYIKAEFHIRKGASTPCTETNLIVVVNHTRSGSREMKIKGNASTALRFKQDARVSFPVDDVSNSNGEIRQFVVPPGDAD